MKEIWRISKLDMREIHSSEVVSFWLKYFITKTYPLRYTHSCKDIHFKIIYGYSKDYLRKINQNFNRDVTSIMSKSIKSSFTLKKSKKKNECDEILRNEPFCLDPYLYRYHHCFIKDNIKTPQSEAKKRAEFLINNEEIVQFFGRFIYKLLWCRLYLMEKKESTEESIVEARKTLELLYPKFVKPRKKYTRNNRASSPKKKKEDPSKKRYRRWIKELKEQQGSTKESNCKRQVSFSTRYRIYEILLEKIKQNASVSGNEIDEFIMEEISFYSTISIRATKQHRLIALDIIEKINQKT